MYRLHTVNSDQHFCFTRKSFANADFSPKQSENVKVLPRPRLSENVTLPSLHSSGRSLSALKLSQSRHQSQHIVPQSQTPPSLFVGELFCEELSAHTDRLVLIIQAQRPR